MIMMKTSYKRSIKWVLIGIFSLITIILLLMFFAPKLYNDKINQQVSILVKEQIKGDVSFSNIELSFFSKFPYLTATIERPEIKGVTVDSLFTEILFKADNVSLGVDILGLISGNVRLNQVFIDNADVNVYVDSTGNNNFDIFYPSNSVEQDNDSDLALKVDKFHIKDANITYSDLSSEVFIDAKGLDYLGRGNMNDAVFDLQSLAKISTFDFVFAGVPYITDKPVTARLDTSIDTNSLTFGFKRNNIKIKNLPVDFKGHFGFIEGGYDMLFDITTKESSLEQLLSILPPSYQNWLDNTEFRGSVSGEFLLRGPYIVSEGIQPDLDFNLRLSEGYLHYNKVKESLEELSLDLGVSMKNFDFNTADVQLKNLSFLLDHKPTRASLYTRGFDQLWLKASIDTEVDLQMLSKTIGITGFDLRGDLHLQGQAEGYFAKGIGSKRTRNGIIRDTIITSIPKFNLQGNLTKGYFKKNSLPSAIEDININLSTNAKDSLLRNVSINFTHIDLIALDNHVKGRFHLKNLSNFDMDAQVQASVDLASIREFIPVENMEVSGVFNTNTTIKGTFEPKKKRFPIIHSEIKLENGFVKMARLPDLPLEEIHIHTIIESKQGSLNDLSVRILPIDFKIAGEPFQLAASFYNLKDLNYNVKSKGVLNLGDFYKLFKIDGLDVKGRIITNLFLSGLQSDAVQGNFDKLKNGGRFEVDDIVITSIYLPKELYIKKGVFKFYKERLKFEKFVATYGGSNFELNGYATNVIDYLLNDQTLQGEFSLKSDFINVDEFFDNDSDNHFNGMVSSSNGNPSSDGTFSLATNLDVLLQADVKAIKYGEYNIKDFVGEVGLNTGVVNLNSTAFDLIGTRVSMEGKYHKVTKNSANFNYHIAASNFDIQRAYHEISLFREMVSMAKDAYGIVSLDYSLRGTLDKDMLPILPSIKGEGILSLDDIKFKGFKLLGAIAEKGDAKGMENASVSQVEIHSIIDNNVLTISRTKMKMAGFRPRFEGQVSLDGQLNIGLRVGLPPLGLIGIPMRVTGTMDDFDIKLGKYKPSEVLGGDSSLDEIDLQEEQENERELEILTQQKTLDLQSVAIPITIVVDSLPTSSL